MVSLFGVDRRRPTFFTSTIKFVLENGLNNNYVCPISLDLRNDQHTTGTVLSYYRVMDLFADADGDLWLLGGISGASIGAVTILGSHDGRLY